MQQRQTAFENIVGKEEIARNEQFLLFPQCFLFSQKIISLFVNIFDIISFFAIEVEEPKISISGIGLHGEPIIQEQITIKELFKQYCSHFDISSHNQMNFISIKHNAYKCKQFRLR